MAEPVLVARRLRAPGLPPAIAALAPTLDFSLAPGTICCLIGAPDTGKTAWLRTLAAVEPPAGGELWIAGNDCAVPNAAAWRRLRAKAAYVSAATPLLSVLNGLANVMLPAQYHGVASSTEISRRAFTWLERLGWDGPLDRLPAYLTRHQRCLLTLARCLVLDPAVLFVNEPFHLTDADGWRHLASVFVSLSRESGLTQVMLTHDLPFVRHHAGRILLTGSSGIREYADWPAVAAADSFREIADLTISEA